MLADAINIFSGAEGLGGALTNPTELARRKGKIVQAYPVLFEGRTFVDVESAYHVLTQGEADAAVRDDIMVELIAAKFRQHLALFGAVGLKGGGKWLATCSHFTQARSEGAQKWQGAGVESRFIRNLVAGFDRAHQPAPEPRQPTLF